MAFCLLAVVLCSVGYAVSTSIDIPECEPPDYPKYGGYGPPPKNGAAYYAGDQIHYYCDKDKYMGGTFLRVCEDTGDWTGKAPFCDDPAEWKSVNQSSTFDKEEENGPDRAADDSRVTCSLTRRGLDQYWSGTFKHPGEVLRILVFTPRADVDYEVFLLKAGGQKFSCGRRTGYVHRLNYEFHTCPPQHNKDAIGVQIITKSDVSLELCDVIAHVLTAPTCDDPSYPISHGRLELTRKVAILVCDAGYTKSPDKQLECVRNNEWSRKDLRCLDPNDVV